ncbi:toll/interleukin-1 receptor domain-containing protein [Rhizobacter sp. AJA081-3]|uniref:toll/interleukin-1 receptor domain-containing protein n=1 Tax=Rhizobacter sp. AJA081-3 TaxID=2753607 RepID=UPI001AE05B6A|nr:toll/interleukin-1 receptor domain-containing protein [Rhizobacter sp. AJA081-3]QTN21425.1 toll/interleukin-1 receptor domain-containing protein [Rhizobacter sp. AJA081-3]
MARTSDRDLFLKRLAKLSGADGGFVTNEALRAELKWEKPKYRAIHSSLRQEELIVVKRGRGGLVALAGNKKTERMKIFVSYSHVDKDLKDRLVKHLRPLEHENLVEVWVDHQIKAGDDWDKEIAKKLGEADIVLTLVSIDFINSKYCYDIELEKALEREADGESQVIPVILRSCLWTKSPLGRLKALPTDGKAVTTWSDIDEALTVVASGVRDAAIALLEHG